MSIPADMRDPEADRRDAQNWRYLKSRTPGAGAIIKFLGGESFQIDFICQTTISAVVERDYLLARMWTLASLNSNPLNQGDFRWLAIEAIRTVEAMRQSAIDAAVAEGVLSGGVHLPASGCVRGAAAAPAGPAPAQAPQSPKASNGESALGAGHE